jgi:hypothetical protein
MKKEMWGFFLEFALPFIVGVITLEPLFRGALHRDSLFWFYASTFQSFVALLGLIGLILAFKIQHLRDQIRDIQNAILAYSRHSLEWIFAGFDIGEINKRKEYLFQRCTKSMEKINEEEDKNVNLQGLESEKQRFDEMLENYEELEKERSAIYDKMISPFYLITGSILISLLGLVFIDKIYNEHIFIFFGTVGLVFWSIIRMCKFIINMMLREKKIRVFMTVDVKDKT